jgi:hypothetical protein
VRPEDDGRQQQADRKDDGTDCRSGDRVHALQRVSQSGPTKKQREDNRQDDDVGEPKIKREEGRRAGARDVHQTPSGFWRDSTSIGKL